MQNCTAIILAGGKSQRMGQPKGLLLFKDHYWIQEQLKRLKSGGISQILIGLGFDSDLYFEAIPEWRLAINKYINYDDIQLKVILNSQPQLGSFSTLKTVLNELNEDVDVLLCPIDVPILKASELLRLLNTKASIVKPVYKNKSGHPIKVDAKFVKHLTDQPFSSRLDTLISKTPSKDIRKVNSIDGQIVMNLNSPKDWNNYINDIILTQKYQANEN